MNATTIKEVLESYNAAKKQWLEKLGENFDETAFHQWFTKQVQK